jgi:hypothetical protein
VVAPLREAAAAAAAAAAATRGFGASCFDFVDSHHHRSILWNACLTNRQCRLLLTTL